jgi:acetylornithine deacetylase/succinyl-diaminopimelate desuccinylase-like protein
MTSPLNSALEYAHQNRDRFLDELIEVVKIPSVSTDPEHKADMQKTAEWVAAKLKAIGMEKVQVLPTGGHPVVYGEYLKAGTDKPTVLIYGHYDVQPPEPLEMWDSEPFKPEVREGKLFGRGASDMKGQMIASISAAQAWMEQGGLPVNVKWLIEGEEEIGSPSLGAFIEKNKELLAGDYALNPDGGILGPETPSIIYSLRGLAYFEVNVQGPEHDLHSGVFGGAVLNPANELARLIGGMHDENGHVTLPGFYDKVKPLSDEERKELARLPLEDDFLLQTTGAPTLWGEKGYTSIERTGARPTLDVNGLLSGFTGKGSKTVLPSKAMAKISMRLVPDQDPEDVHQSLVKYLEDNVRPGVKWEVLSLAGGPASITPRDSAAFKAMADAMETVWGVKPVFKREGGSVPVVAQMKTILGMDSVMSGFGLPDDNLHAPNEKLSLAPWYKGIDALVHFLNNLGSSK